VTYKQIITACVQMYGHAVRLSDFTVVAIIFLYSYLYPAASCVIRNLRNVSCSCDLALGF